jgi:hypothetical protein
MLWMTPIVNDAAAQSEGLLNNSTAAQEAASDAAARAQATATKAHLGVTNHQGIPEQYKLELLEKGKLVKTWPITLNDGQTWQQTIAWSTNYGESMLADLYLLPNTTTPFHYVNNGICAINIKDYTPVLRPEDPCDGRKS